LASEAVPDAPPPAVQALTAPRTVTARAAATAAPAGTGSRLRVDRTWARPFLDPLFGMLPR
jgi:hypothetical protein